MSATLGGPLNVERLDDTDDTIGGDRTVFCFLEERVFNQEKNFVPEAILFVYDAMILFHTCKNK